MSYLCLVIAIIGEVVGTTLLKVSDGFSKLGIGILSLLLYGVCFIALSFALKQGMSLNVAYAVWSGAGIVLTSLIGVLIWREAMQPVHILGLALIIAGVIVVNLFGSTH
ncbi:multidrug efflux SMR transporter [Limosilactobacillus agrestis]|uniref:Multidrug efflux SMR transporter n=1 Tax=Limosilactobacillus agrestis TaxID=2759748 RepID=A0ABS8R5S4_9LACO|nr:multidrug efflux SMR transporter [Limosilactobacillus agrestis]MCD7129930.1 multidrug efflux SMR transporter [Limosilactobacillus agrestis]